MTTPIENGVVRLPAWFIGIVVGYMGIGVSWAGWLSVTVISTRTELVELRTQVRSTAVPEGTEKALNELRGRMNAELTGRDALQKLAIENSKDIAYNSKEIEQLKREILTIKKQ